MDFYREAVMPQSPGLLQPWDRRLIDYQPTRGCAARQLRLKCFCETTTTTTPLGLFSFSLLSQGSREARQPWALGRNRFAVRLDLSALRFSFRGAPLTTV